MKNIYKLLFSLGFLGAIAFTGKAQSQPLQFHNHGGCSFLVRAAAVNPNNCKTCTVGTYCVSQYSSISINPCGSAGWDWIIVEVVPVEDNCMNPCPPGQSGTAVNSFALAAHANCGYPPNQGTSAPFQDCCGAVGVIKWDNSFEVTYYP